MTEALATKAAEAAFEKFPAQNSAAPTWKAKDRFSKVAFHAPFPGREA